MAGVAEARLELERESIVLPPAEATPVHIIESTKGLFTKGFSDLEFIGTVGDAQICYIELFDVGDATNYQELGEDIKLNLLNDDYVVEGGMVGDSATIQASLPEAQKALSGWTKDESNYFSLEGESGLSAAQQIERLVDSAMIVAKSSNELDKLQFILRPTVLHDNLLKAIMEARGVELRRIEVSD